MTDERRICVKKYSKSGGINGITFLPSSQLEGILTLIRVALALDHKIEIYFEDRRSGEDRRKGGADEKN